MAAQNRQPVLQKQEALQLAGLMFTCPLTVPACLKYELVLWLAWMRLWPPLNSATMSIPREKRSLDTLHTDLC